MGKKRVIVKSKEELLKETEKVESKVEKEYLPSTKKKIKEGRIYIFSTFNNTIITLTNLNGDVVSWVSAGKIGFKGTKKATPFAASKVAGVISQIAEKLGIKEIEIKVKGIGAGRDSALRFFSSKGFDIKSIQDITPIPHNGCRLPKPRRV
ncbi:MAG TPA: 30S ribosomal protein S11 [bacterium]|nr:30S ribosomal protein S11 [bacterium]